MTDCNTQMSFNWYKKRDLIVDYNRGEITSGARLLLLRQADQTLGLVSGVHIMAVEWEEIVPEITERAGLLPRPTP